MNSPLQASRDGFGLGLLQAGQLDEKVVAVTADLTESTRLNWFATQFPERLFQVGVAEQNAVGVGAGLALGGLKPFVASYASFSPANSWGVIRTSVCYNNAPVVIVGGHAGLVTGEDGATHQSLEDIAIMRVLPNMTVVVPCDAEEARQATLALTKLNQPSYLRLSKLPVAQIHTQEMPFIIGESIQLRDGSDLTIIACGSLVFTALQVAHNLETTGFSCRVINMHTIKPIDEKAIWQASQETALIATLEDHQVIGGLGGAVAEVLAESEKHPPLLKFGMQDAFGESGRSGELLEKYHLDAQSISKLLRQKLKTLS